MVSRAAARFLVENCRGLVGLWTLSFAKPDGFPEEGEKYTVIMHIKKGSTQYYEITL
jgi:hypothetical protein